MTTYNTDGRYSLRALEQTNIIKEIDDGFRALRDDIDAIIAAAFTGTASARPTSTPASPGKFGRIYRAADTGDISFDTGTGWIPLAQAGALADEIAARIAAVNQKVDLTDSRLSDSRPPTGGAGGDLVGNYPSPAVVGEVNANASAAWTFDPSGLLTASYLLPQASQGKRFRRRYMRNQSHGSTNTNLRQALFGVIRDVVNWQPTAPVEVIIKTVGQGNGGYSRSIIRGGYSDDPPRVDVLEAAGNHPIVPLMSANQASYGNFRNDYVYLDLPPYTDVLVQITYNHTETTTNPYSSGGLATIAANGNGPGQIFFDVGYADNTGAGGSVWTGERVQKHAAQHASGGPDPLPNGSVSLAMLGFDVATQAELDAEIAARTARQPLVGRVAADGSIPSGFSGYTPSHPSTGRYVVTYTAAFAKTPILTPIVGSLGGAGVYIAEIIAESTTGFEVRTYNIANQSVGDYGFSFTATPAP